MSTLREATVMVVDDDPRNLAVLGEILETAGFRVVAFTQGRRAVDAARSGPPDAVLLDACMPGMDGFTTCRELRSLPGMDGVPIIFVSALGEPSQRVTAFEAGAADYVTKPIFPTEVVRRVEVHLRARRLQLALEAHNRDLETLVNERSHELAEANRQLTVWDAAKDDWLNFLAHEIRTPATGILGVADLLIEDLPPEAQPGLAQAYAAARRRLVTLIDDALLLTTLKVGSTGMVYSTLDLERALQHAVSMTAPRVAPTPLRLGPVEAGLPRVVGAQALVERALAEIIWTVACCSGVQHELSVTVRRDEDKAHVDVVARGAPVPQDIVKDLFDLRGPRRMMRPSGDVGLAPALGRQILRFAGGDVVPAWDQHGCMALRISVVLSRPAAAPHAGASP